MKIHTTNYRNAFIKVADDCPVKMGEMPPVKGDKLTAANIQFDLIIKNPYTFTSDDVLFNVYAQKHEIPKAALAAAREQFFSKGQPCLRASPLTKRYGWGVHSDNAGKVALYACDSPEYRKLSADKKLEVVKAMRSGK